MSRPRAARRARATLAIAVLVAAGCVAAGCATVSPPPDDLATRHVGSPEAFAEASFGPHVSAADVGPGWLAHFGDPVLEELVREAWAHNPDLYVAAARFEEAAASLRTAASYLYPQASGTGGASHTEYDGSRDEDSYTAGVGVSWEADLWGRIRSDKAAARGVAEASGLDYLQARHSLAASVALAYYAVVTAKEQLAIDSLLLDAERFTAETTRQRVEAGLGTSMDDDIAESSVRLAEAAVQQDLAALRAARRALEILLGRYPAAELAGTPATLPRIDAGPIAIGVPSALLERRPDIRSAELRVDAAYYGVESARAARLPSLTLRADANWVFDPTEFVSTVAADILAPLFRGGRLLAEQEAASARQRQALGQFAAVALRAFGEVEDALSNERYLRTQEASLEAASERLVRAGETAISRYDQGLLTILELQQVRRSDFSTRSQLLGVRFELLRQRLGLYLALGGPVLSGEADDPDRRERADALDARFQDPGRARITKTLHVGDRPTGSPDEPGRPEANDGG